MSYGRRERDWRRPARQRWFYAYSMCRSLRGSGDAKGAADCAAHHAKRGGFDPAALLAAVRRTG